MRRIYVIAAVLFATRTAGAVEPAEIPKVSGIGRGLVCVVGDADGVAEGLAREGSFLVHQLVEAKRVAERRQAAAKAGLLGRLVIEEKREALPYPDRFIDLLVIAAGREVAETERQRVLAVDGAALLANGTLWQPRPDPRLDEWTHKWHGPDGNPLSRDTVSGPPTAVQWAAGPMFTDGAIGGKAPRIGGGAFVFIDTVDGALVARSAANGLPRWRADHDFAQTADLVLHAGQVLAHVKPAAAGKANTDEAGPLTAFDLATGKELVRFEKGLVNPGTPGQAKLGIAQFLAQGDGILQAIGPEMAWLGAKTGQRRWERKLDGAHWFAPLILGDRVIAVETEQPAQRRRIDNTPHARAIAAFNLADGKPLWRTADILPPHKPPIADNITRVSLSPPVAAEGIVLLHAGCYQSRLPDAFVAALDAANGRELWRHTIPEKDYTNTVESSRVVLLNGVAFYLGGRGVAAWDARTGKEKFPFRKRPKYAFNGYGECSGSRCTVNWLMANGLCYWSLNGDLVTTTWAARSACGTGVFPAYGMVFALPTGCDCITYSRGYLGLSCTPLPKPIPDDQRLVKGPAFGQVGRPAAPVRADGDWPMFLHDPQRSGAAAKELPEKLRVVWQTKVAEPPTGAVAADRRLSENYLGALSAPVVADLVVVARPEQHQVVALDPASGKERWSFTAGGRIDSPPTLYQGLALFGSQDGQVYALRLADGTLVWRFLAAPIERKAVLHGQLSSAFPVHGSVLVLDDKVIASAGFHSDLGGIHVWVLEPFTGAIVRKVVYQGSPAGDRPALNDILAADSRATTAWLGLDAGFTTGGEVVKGGKRNAIPIERRPIVAFDRNGAFVRFPHDFRGGSTHGWKGGMVSEFIQAHRVCLSGDMTYALADPRDSDRHPVRADAVPVVRAIRNDPKTPVWLASCKALGTKESYSALIAAGNRLYVGGGRRDGSAGFVQVLDAATGKLLAEHQLPGRVVECGLAAAGARLYVSCEDGTLACLGE